MKEKKFRPRTDSFLWETRQDLYSFFKDRHNVDTSRLDAEIERAREEFCPRKGKAIRPQELWQKVGLKLACELGVDLVPPLQQQEAEPDVAEFEIDEISDQVEQRPDLGADGEDDEPLFDVDLP